MYIHIIYLIPIHESTTNYIPRNTLHTYTYPNLFTYNLYTDQFEKGGALFLTLFLTTFLTVSKISEQIDAF